MDNKPLSEGLNTCKPGWVKIWPMIGFSSIGAKHAGAWRLWSLVRQWGEGSGGIGRIDFLNRCDELGINERQRRRWLADAMALGLLWFGKARYYHASAERAAVILGVRDVGRPAFVKASGLVDRGWRSLVWSAYLSTLGRGAVISQDTKYLITGISPRVQRYYQAARSGRAIKNFADRGRVEDVANGKLLAGGFSEGQESDYFILEKGKFKGHIFQRLPDSRVVSRRVAVPGNKGRSKKVQAAVNFSLKDQRDSTRCKLFYSGKDCHKRAARAARSKDGDQVKDVFALSRGLSPSFHNWSPVYVSMQ